MSGCGTMSYDVYNPLEVAALLSEALPPFTLDASMMYHQLRRCQDVTLLSYVETPGLEQYYSSLPVPPQQYGTSDTYYGPSYVRKRNERERQRVKCVNEGYARLRRHLPQQYTEKRLSKVQTLRAAINYISHLQEALQRGDTEESTNTTQRGADNHRYGR